MCYQHSYAPRHHGDANGEEKPDEPLGVVTEIAAIIFLVAVHGILALLDEHGVDLMEKLFDLKREHQRALEREGDDIDREATHIRLGINSTYNMMLAKTIQKIIPTLNPKR